MLEPKGQETERQFKTDLKIKVSLASGSGGWGALGTQRERTGEKRDFGLATRLDRLNRIYRVTENSLAD